MATIRKTMPPDCFGIQRLTDGPSVYLFSRPGGASPLIAVHCQNKGDDPFPEAANIMQSLTGLSSSRDWLMENWDQDSAKKDGSLDVRELGEALEELDDPNTYDLWNFDVCTVQVGDLKDMQFVAIGSNADKRKRAGNLALALLAASRMEPAAEPEAGTHRFSELVETLRPWMSSQLDGYGSIAQPLPSHPAPPKLDVHGSTAAPSHLQPPPPPPPSAPKPSQHSKRSGEPASTAYASPPQHYQPQVKVTERQASPPLFGAQMREASVESDCSEVIVYQQQVPKQNDDNVQASAWLSPNSDAEISSEQTDRDITTQPPAHPPWTRLGGEHPHGPNDEFESLRHGLEAQWEALTISSIGQEDTIPCGTDLDPANYNNMWAASKTKDENAKLLFTHDLGWRILDAENLGFTYGLRVLGKEKHFHIDGVRKAIAHFVQDGLRVIVIGQRQSLQQDLAAEVQTGRCHVIVADSTDDVIILKKAFEKRCPVVSRDLFRKQLADCRIDPKLRSWYREKGANLQVKYTFGENGAFEPDYVLHMPILQRRSSGVVQSSRVELPATAEGRRWRS